MTQHECEMCGRLIRHKGYCFACNIKKSNEEIEHRHDLAMGNHSFSFPHAAMRGPQQEMIKDVKRAVENKRHLIADAPTGLGKTVASLFPAVEYAVKNEKTVFFLTSRVSQHRMAVETLKDMRKTSTPFSAVDIVGKRHLCSQDVSDMDSTLFNSYCTAMIKDKKCKPYKNFYNPAMTNQRNALIKKIIIDGPLATEESLSMLSGRFCAYEMLVEAAKGASVIVGDYFHLFGMGDKFLKRTGKNVDDIIIIVDEAHNLSTRLRSYMSSRISTRTCELAAKEAANFSEHDAKDEINEIKSVLREMDKGQEAFVSREEFMDRIKKINNYSTILTKLSVLGDRVLEEKKASAVDRLANFLHAWETDEKGFSRIVSTERIRGKDHYVLQFNCLDPSIISRNIIAGSHSTILMSGTLSPMEMHRDLLGMQTDRTDMHCYESPFPKENRKNIIVTGMSTRYSERTNEKYSQMASMIALSISAIKGNTAVFFPSYMIRNRIYELISGHVKKHIILEKSGMTKQERDEVKDDMKEHQEKGAVLLGVMGGSFSEGIDLPGNLLNGVIIVGLPLERPNLQVEAVIKYYDERFQKGRDYGYNFPAMIKVMQAAGRCIRTEKDRGVVIFMDDRFTWKNYSGIFPRTWDFVTTRRPEIEIKKFFGRM